MYIQIENVKDIINYFPAILLLLFFEAIMNLYQFTRPKYWNFKKLDPQPHKVIV